MNNKTLKIADMDTNSKVAIWFNRALFILVSILFTMIGLRNIFNPYDNAVLANITLGSPNALSVARVSMGAFPFSFAVIIFSCLFSVNRIYFGITSVFTLITIVLVVRIMGFVLDGAAPFIAPEAVVTVLSGIGVFLESRRLKAMKANS